MGKPVSRIDSQGPGIEPPRSLHCLEGRHLCHFPLHQHKLLILLVAEVGSQETSEAGHQLLKVLYSEVCNAWSDMLSSPIPQCQT